jgi:hypothetical protein
MAQRHNSKAVKEQLNKIESLGFTLQRTKKGIQITPPEGRPGPVYNTHVTEAAFHQIRRDFLRLYGVEL